jgi:hypothetical protein
MMMMIMGHECKRGMIWREAKEWGGEKERIQKGKRTEICYMYMFKDNTIKPTKCCMKRERKKRGWSCSNYTIHMYGITMMKPPHAINILIQNIIKPFEKKESLIWDLLCCFWEKEKWTSSYWALCECLSKTRSY